MGGRKATTLIVVLWGICTLLVGLVPAAGVLSPVVVLMILTGLRFLMGAAQAPFFP